MKDIWKHSGHFPTATGIIHTAVALWMFRGTFLTMAKNGLVNTGDDGPVFWFMLPGPLLIMFGPQAFIVIVANYRTKR